MKREPDYAFNVFGSKRHKGTREGHAYPPTSKFTARELCQREQRAFARSRRRRPVYQINVYLKQPIAK